MKETTASVMGADAEHWKAQYRELVAEYDEVERSVIEVSRLLAEVLRLIASANDVDTETEAQISIARRSLEAPVVGRTDGPDHRLIRDLVSRALRSNPTSPAVDESSTTRELRDKLMAVDGFSFQMSDDYAHPDAVIDWVDQLVNHLHAQTTKLTETERFLSEVRSALDGLEGLVGALSKDLSAGRSATIGLQSDVRATVGALEDNVAASDDLADLKEKVRHGIQALGSRVSRFGESEAARLDQAEQRNAELKAQLSTMESQVETLESALAQQRTLALKDALTEVHSRGALAARVDEEVARHNREDAPLSYAIWDIDHFKRINDEHGHPAGDSVLHQVAQILEQYTRASDFVARLGGEEFVILLPNTPSVDAMTIVNKLRELLAASRFEWEGNPIPVTVSCGVAVLSNAESADDLYARADRALYQAKRSGRNRCELAS
ncbi:MAG: diguanylate cyclase [Pseudomonadota bacterium]